MTLHRAKVDKVINKMVEKFYEVILSQLELGRKINIKQLSSAHKRGMLL